MRPFLMLTALLFCGLTYAEDKPTLADSPAPAAETQSVLVPNETVTAEDADSESSAACCTRRCRRHPVRRCAKRVVSAVQSVRCRCCCR